MEQLNEQPAVETKPVAKAIISATALIASFTAGTQLDNQQIKTLQDDNQAKVQQLTVLENEKQTIELQKKNLTKDYVYSQITSGRIPTIDGSMVSLNDVQEAYTEIVGAVNMSDSDMFKKAKDEAKKRGDYICK